MLDLADFTFQEQAEHSLMVTMCISRAWYNGSYTMAAKPIKSLEMHYTMIQFLIMNVTSKEMKCFSFKGSGEFKFNSEHMIAHMRIVHLDFK